VCFCFCFIQLRSTGLLSPSAWSFSNNGEHTEIAPHFLQRQMSKAPAAQGDTIQEGQGVGVCAGFVKFFSQFIFVVQANVVTIANNVVSAVKRSQSSVKRRKRRKKSCYVWSALCARPRSRLDDLDWELTGWWFIGTADPDQAMQTLWVGRPEEVSRRNDPVLDDELCIHARPIFAVELLPVLCCLISVKMFEDICIRFVQFVYQGTIDPYMTWHFKAWHVNVM
jgi:hypothetical protein